MRITRIAAHNVGPLGDVDVTFDDSMGRLVAIVGANGSGKSTFLELVPAAITRSLPTRGPATGLATAKDSWFEVQIETTEPLLIRHAMDGIVKTPKSESYVENAEGLPQLSSSKVREFDAWARLNLPDPSVYLSSAFSVQGSGGFLDMDPSDRKAVLLRVLELEQYEALAEQARKNASAARADLRAVVERKAELMAGTLGDVEQEKGFLAQFRRDAENQATALRSARETLAAAERANAAQSLAFEAAKDAAHGYQVAQTRAETAKSSHGRAAAALTRAQGLAADLPMVREAWAQLTKTKRCLEDAKLQRVQLTGRLEQLADQVGTCRRRMDDQNNLGRKAEARADAAAIRTRDGGEAKAKVEALADLPERIEAAERAQFDADTERGKVNDAWKEAEGAVKALRGQQLLGAGDRIHDLRTGLELVELGVNLDDALGAATRTLHADDEVVKTAQELPAKVEAADVLCREAFAKLEAASSERSKAGEALTKLRAEKGRLEDLQRLADTHDQAKADADTAIGEARAAQLRIEELTGDLGQLTREQQTNVESLAGGDQGIAQLEAEAQQVVDEAARLSEVDAAAQSLPELFERTDEALSQAEAAEAEFLALDAPGDASKPPDLDFERGTVERLERQDAEGRAIVTRREQMVERLEQRDARAAELSADEQRVARGLEDWTKLSRDLGRDGLQALEIDAAGPELASIANGLLHECFGTRFTIDLQTTRTAGKGGKTKEVEAFIINVVDTVRGRDGPASNLSGGEQVVVGEAISLALSVMACRKSGMVAPTLVRDESGAALDPENARAYITMLRRAADLVGADRVLLVSHSPEVVGLCDSRIDITNGAARVT